jgi:hypothetical protein
MGLGRAAIAVALVSAGFVQDFHGMPIIRRARAIGAAILLFVPFLCVDIAGILIGAGMWLPRTAVPTAHQTFEGSIPTFTQPHASIACNRSIVCPF